MEIDSTSPEPAITWSSIRPVNEIAGRSGSKSCSGRLCITSASAACVPRPLSFRWWQSCSIRKASSREYVQQTEGTVPPPGVVGFYSPQTNRVLLYDVTHGQAADADWQQNASTIIHEATHQMAFNTHIHNRAAVPPRWAGEGLAMLFEAPGVWNAQQYPLAKDRINQGRLSAFREYAGGQRPEGSLPLFVQNSERLFSAAPAAAYCEAWALTFFLSETEPAKYLQYLARTAAREPLREYSAKERLQEFTDVFGTDLKMLEARYLRFIAAAVGRTREAER